MAPENTLQKQQSFQALLHRHVRGVFAGHGCERRAWTLGPMPELNPDFHVLEIAPGPITALWTYVSVGGATISQIGAEPLEFMLQSGQPSPRMIELVTMVAHYNHRVPLGDGHTIPIGEPWMPGSACDHLLVLRPYGFDPELESIAAAEGAAHLLWIVPITEAEREFKIEHGVEALRARCGRAAFQYWNPERASLVP